MRVFIRLKRSITSYNSMIVFIVEILMHMYFHSKILILFNPIVSFLQ